MIYDMIDVAAIILIVVGIWRVEGVLTNILKELKRK